MPTKGMLKRRWALCLAVLLLTLLVFVTQKYPPVMRTPFQKTAERTVAITASTRQTQAARVDPIIGGTLLSLTND